MELTCQPQFLIKRSHEVGDGLTDVLEQRHRIFSKAANNVNIASSFSVGISQVLHHTLQPGLPQQVPASYTFLAWPEVAQLTIRYVDVPTIV